jgi:hypothetical protein
LNKREAITFYLAEYKYIILIAIAILIISNNRHRYFLTLKLQYILLDDDKNSGKRTIVYHCYINLTDHRSPSSTKQSPLCRCNQSLRENSLIFVGLTSPSPTKINPAFIGLTSSSSTTLNLSCVGLTNPPSVSSSVQHVSLCFIF